MLPIKEIEKRASLRELVQARHFTADHLHVPSESLSNTVAIAYVVRHFEMGAYSGWEGFAEMLEVDRRTEETVKAEK